LFACILAVICGWVAYAVYGAASQSRALDAQVTRLQTDNASLQAQIDERQRQIAAAQTLAWLEEEARKLGYVMPGEHVYVVTPPGSAVPSGGGVNAKLPTYSPTPAPTPTPTPTASPSGPPRLVAPPVRPTPVAVQPPQPH
jgi:cell division protein FtsB